MIPSVPKTAVSNTGLSNIGSSNKEFSKTIVGEDAMVRLGEALGNSLFSCGGLGAVPTEKSIEATSVEGKSALVFFEGDLGAGKTTLCRGILQAFGHHGAVKSPTYTLVEPYERAGGNVYHFDLYRHGDAEELEFMGIRDYFGENSVCLVEWADRGLGVLPAADIVVCIETENSGRRLSVSGASDRGRSALERLGERYRG